MDGGPRIAIDAMGGDAGPAAMITGAAKALRRDPDLRFTFYGDERQVEELIGKHRALANASTVVHSAEAIAASESWRIGRMVTAPIRAVKRLRQGRVPAPRAWPDGSA